MSIQQNFPNTRPSLSINFARSQRLDPRITFTRTTSGTRTNSDGLIEVVPANSPRFDFDPISGESLGLLVEEQRTNLLLRSEDFTTTWTNFNSTDASNTANAPDGNTTADTLISNIGVTDGLLRQNVSGLADNTTYTLSVFLKTAGLTNVSLQFYNKANTFHGSKTINLSTGVLSGSEFVGTSSVVNYGNGWYRLILTNLGSGTGATTPNVRIVALSTGDGTSGIYIWGAQLEAGAFPTSYIPTTTSTATRTADNASITGSNFSDFYNPSEGTIYAQFRCDNWNASNSFGKVFTINEGIFGVENNGFWIGNDANTSNSVRYRVRASGTNQFGPANLIRTSNVVKSALSVKTSDFAATIDGNASTTSTSGTLSTSMTNMTIGRDIVGIDNGFLNGHIQQLTYYPARLSNQVLQNLTK